MKVKIEFDCDNAAFFDAADRFNQHEVAKILKNLAAYVTQVSLISGDKLKIFDSNGNSVGLFEVKES